MKKTTKKYLGLAIWIIIALYLLVVQFVALLYSPVTMVENIKTSTEIMIYSGHGLFFLAYLFIFIFLGKKLWKN